MTIEVQLWECKVDLLGENDFAQYLLPDTILSGFETKKAVIEST